MLAPYVPLSDWLHRSEVPVKAETVMKTLGRLNDEYLEENRSLVEAVNAQGGWRRSLFACARAHNPSYLTMIAACQEFDSVKASKGRVLPVNAQVPGTAAALITTHVVGDPAWMFDEGMQSPYLAEVFWTRLAEGRLPNVVKDRKREPASGVVVRALARGKNLVRRVSSTYKPSGAQFPALLVQLQL